MKILVVNSLIPYPLNHGGNSHIYNIFQGLKGKHQIYLLCFIKNESQKVHLKALENIFDKVETVLWKYPKNSFIEKVTRLIRIYRWDYIYSKNKILAQSVVIFRDKIVKMINDYSIDIMHVHLQDMAHLCYGIKLVPKLLDAPDCLSLTKERALSLKNKKTIYYLYEKLLLHKTKQYERIITKYFNACTTVSKVDAKYYKKLNQEVNWKIIQNGVDLNYFRKNSSIDEVYPSVIFWGNMDFAPNIDAVKYFYSEIFPEIRKHFTNITFYVVGSSPVVDILDIGKDKHVTVTGFVDDIRPWIDKSTICITPLRIGSGIKTKILEALAMQKAVVSTSIGIGGISISPGDDIVVADTPKEFAESVIRLINNEKNRAKIAINGRKLVEDKYNWNTTSNNYEMLYYNILENMGA